MLAPTLIDPRHLWRIEALSGEDVVRILDAAERLWRAHERGWRSEPLRGRNVAIVRGDPPPSGPGSLRGAATALGARVAHLRPEEVAPGGRDDAQATARLLGRLYDAIDCEDLAPGFFEVLARDAGVPVYNGLGLASHPTGVLAEWLALHDRLGKPLSEMRICFVGDANTASADAFILSAAIIGVDLRVCAPASAWPGTERRLLAQRHATARGRNLRFLTPEEAAQACAEVDAVIDGRGDPPWPFDAISESQCRESRHFTLQGLLVTTMP